MSEPETSIDVAALRADLERTGNLATRNDEDPGHLSSYWRRRVTDLCDALEAGASATNGAAPMPRTPPEEVEALVAGVRNVLVGDVEAKFARAVFLIAEALPVMQTLNNARSSKWLPVAEALLADGSVVRF